MGTDPSVDQNESSPEHQEEPSPGGGDHIDHIRFDDSGSFATNDALVPIIADDGNQLGGSDLDSHVVGADAVNAGTGDLLGANDLLGAVTSMSTDAVSNVDHTLDHLITSTDLFDVPALDFHDILPT